MDGAQAGSSLLTTKRSSCATGGQNSTGRAPLTISRARKHSTEKAYKGAHAARSGGRSPGTRLSAVPRTRNNPERGKHLGRYWPYTPAYILYAMALALSRTSAILVVLLGWGYTPGYTDCVFVFILETDLVHVLLAYGIYPRVNCALRQYTTPCQPQNIKCRRGRGSLRVPYCAYPTSWLNIAPYHLFLRARITELRRGAEGPEGSYHAVNIEPFIWHFTKTPEPAQTLSTPLTGGRRRDSGDMT